MKFLKKIIEDFIKTINVENFKKDFFHLIIDIALISSLLIVLFYTVK